MSPKPYKSSSAKSRRRRKPEFPRLEKTSSAGAVINQLIERMGATDRIRQQRAVLIWADTVGAEIARVAKAESIDHGKLKVKVNNPTWRNELTYLKDRIRDQLNGRLGETVVSDIVFR